ncbi:hypothetical protein KFE25_000079 [Diacronema lutheri]|uniref:non-specific serine/threonine protein kinase n=1 Tax=Diacronema lutheri TaxID=2081491 RepID=A0A8J6CAB3_DIALT|nr:hypothetical protein KFE25_000079 [Diacronema lutheri]
MPEAAIVTKFVLVEADPNESYALRSYLGSGAQGSVNVVERRADGVKLVLKENDVSKMGASSFERACGEVVNLALAINHGNIIRFHEAWISVAEHGGAHASFRIVVAAADQTEGGGLEWRTAADILELNRGGRCKVKLCIVMDYADGGTLGHQIKLARESGCPISESRIILWIGHMALGLMHLHSRGILHRDLKTANIFLTPAGCIKIGDFGISKLIIDTDDGLAHTTTGTPLYMSPEILRGEAYGYASDVWGLGCVLVELMTLEYAFKADSFPQLYLNIEQVKLANALPDAYSPELRALVPRLLTRDERERITLLGLLQEPVIKHAISKWILSVVHAPPRA